MKNIKTGTCINYTNDESYNFKFATNLSAYDKVVFVRTVVDTLVEDTIYDSIIRDMIFDFTIVMRLTDIDTSFTKAVDDDGNEISPLILIEQFLDETNVVDVVKANMEIGLLEQLNEAVDKSIEYRTGIHPTPINDALASLIKTFEKKIEEVDTSSMMAMAQKFVNMTGDLNVDDIVKAYVDSDLHKKNLEEIADSKKNNKTKKNEIKIDEGLGEAIRSVIKESKAEKAEVVKVVED